MRARPNEDGTSASQDLRIGLLITRCLPQSNVLRELCGAVRAGPLTRKCTGQLLADSPPSACRCSVFQCSRAWRSGRCFTRPEAGRIGRHEGERTRLVVPVLGQVEADPPHLMPFRRPSLQECGQPAGARDRLPHPAVQALPDALQYLFAEILAAVHGRGGQNPARAVGGGQGLDLEAFRILGNVAQTGEMALRELLPVAHARHAPGRGLLRREGEEGFALVGLEGALQGWRSRRRGLVPGGFPAQTSRRRQSYAHAPVAGRVPDTRRPPGTTPASTASRPRSPSIGPARHGRRGSRPSGSPRPPSHRVGSKNDPGDTEQQLLPSGRIPEDPALSDAPAIGINPISPRDIMHWDVGGNCWTRSMMLDAPAPGRQPFGGTLSGSSSNPQPGKERPCTQRSSPPPEE